MRLRRAVVAGVILASGFGTAAWADGTVVSGESDPSEPLLIQPSEDARASANIDLEHGTRVFFLDPMPKTMRVGAVDVGDIARGSACTTNPAVDLTVREFESGEDLRGGDVVSQSLAPATLTRTLQTQTWFVDPVTLVEGQSYAFEVKRASGSCRIARQRSWAHNEAQVNGGDRSCALLQDGTDRLRLWHEQGENDASNCSTVNSLSNFDPPMPEGWLQVDRGETEDSVTTGSGNCAEEVGAVEAPNGTGVVCRFPAFANPGATVDDGWYYGLPWSGPGLDGSPRDMRFALQPEVDPGAETQAASALAPTAATLNGSVDPRGTLTRYRFEWGPDSSYGSTIPTSPVTLGDPWGTAQLEQRLIGLEPGETYHFRISAAHGSGDWQHGEDQTFSTPSEPVVKAPPTIDRQVDGVEQTLVASPGRWAGTPPISYRYQWRRCEGPSCVDINGATRKAYVPEAADLDKRLRVVVTAENSEGSASATSEPSELITAVAPVATVDPSVHGTPREGESLAADRGEWTASLGPIDYSYQWQLCDPGGDDCSDIDGATDPRLALDAGHVGGTVRVRVTATDHGQSRAAVSDSSPVIGAATLVNTEPPELERTTEAGAEVLTADVGTWTGATPIAYSFRWQSCAPTGDACFSIAGATGQSYAIRATDAGTRIRVQVTAKNVLGSETAVSAPTAVLDKSAPSNTAAPAVRGTAAVGGELTAMEGTWEGTRPLEYSYLWQRCDSQGDACAAIPGATADTYEPTTPDVGNTLRVAVTAENAEGSATERSAPSPVVHAQPTLSNTTPPELVGEMVVGQSISTDSGTWAGQGTVSYDYQWERCDFTGTGCSEIDGATSSAYTLTTEDEGQFLAVVVIASDEIGSAQARAVARVSVRTVGSPGNSALPTISGTAREGVELLAEPGTWSGSVTDQSFQWQSCDPAGDDCEDIGGAVGSGYELTEADVGSRIRVLETASTAQGTTIAASEYTAVVRQLAPENVARPTLSGSAREGQTLTAADGSWQGFAPLSYSRQWQRCDLSGDCEDIPGATGQTYTLVGDDVDSSVRVSVTASSSLGTTTEHSRSTFPVASLAAPTNTAAPTLAAPENPGDPYEASTGLWSGTDPLTYAYQWERCDPEGGGCHPIAQATGETYLPGPEDHELTIRVVVTASDSEGSAAAASSSSSVLDTTESGSAESEGLAPLSPPAIDGPALEGSLLAVSPGLWNTPQTPAFSYQWRRCHASGRDCADIADASDETYTPGAPDIGSTLRVRVWATSEGESATVTTQATAPIRGATPENTALPTISGSMTDGAQLSGTPGAWTNAPDEVDYQWQRCTGTGTECEDILGETASTLRLSRLDIGHAMRLRVTATRAGSSAAATSSPTAPIGAAAPTNTVTPRVLGDAIRRGEMSATKGTWSGTPTISYGYQWQRCAASGESPCTDIAGATSRDYTATGDDVGSRIRVEVTATNSGGSSTARSTLSAVIASGSPTVQQAPFFTGAPARDTAVDANPGTWNGIAPITFEYQWRRCDEDGTDCQDIAGATDSEYVPTGDDVGGTLRVKVTATNEAGAEDATSEASSVVGSGAPQNTAQPWILADPLQGVELMSDPGSWEGAATLSYDRQWERCDANGESCQAIAGATGEQYTPTAGDLDQTLRLAVTATNAYGSQTEYSPVTAPVRLPDPISSAFPPSVSGYAHPGQVLTASTGDWSGTWPTTFEYEWLRCDESENNCAAIPSADQETYSPSQADVGHTLRVTVTGAGPGGNASARSDATEVVTNAAPRNEDVPPSIAGAPWIGQEFVVSDPGEWSGNEPISRSYRWQRCESADGPCVDISQANGSTYTLTGADAGAHVRVVETATNSEGSDESSSSPSPVVVTAAATNTRPPSVEGVAAIGASLFPATGSWSTEPSWYDYRWLRCDPQGENCSEISEAVGSWTYYPQEADRGHSLRVEEIAHWGEVSETARSAPSAVVYDATGPPRNTTQPSIDGSPQLGHELAATTGVWDGGRPLTFTYQWQRCASSTNCSNISGATNSRYTPASADLAHRIRVRVSAQGQWGQTNVAYSSLTQAIADPPLAGNTTPPSVNGQAVVDGLLTADEGEWEGAVRGYTYQWRRCDVEGENCAAIAGATNRQYRATTTDRGHRLRVQVSAYEQTPDESMIAVSALTAVVTLPDPPVNTEPPMISGTAEVGQWVDSSTGTWGSDAQIDYAFQWERCDDAGRDCEEITDGRGSSYRVTHAEKGHTLLVSVTATNTGGSRTVRSEATSIVPDPPPLSNVSAPSISPWSQAVEGGWISADAGLWDGEPDLSYQWQRCDPLIQNPEPAGSECVDIAKDASEPWYLAGTEDVGYQLRLKVIATAGQDTKVAYSNMTVLQVSPSPSMEELRYTGAAAVGSELTAVSEVDPHGLPLETTYRFERLYTNSEPVVLQDGTDDTYEPSPADVGHAIRITATHSISRADDAAVAGTETQTVETPAVDTAIANESAPAVTGTARAGSTLSAAPGQWSGGGGALEYRYQWQRCMASEPCADITDATGETYKLTLEDIGATVRVRVTASRAGSEGDATSGSSDTVAAATAMSNTTRPSISGELREGEVLEADRGAWVGDEPVEYSFQWEACDETDGACQVIPGATKTTYRLARDQVDMNMRIVVTTTNGAGAATEPSELSEPIGPAGPPVSVEAPELTQLGPPAPRSVITTTAGRWDNADALDVEYQWLRCNAAGESCAPVSVVDGEEYRITYDDVGSRIQVRATATNLSGTASARSELSPVITDSEDHIGDASVFVAGEREAIAVVGEVGAPEVVAHCGVGALAQVDDCALYGPKISPNGRTIVFEVNEPERKLGDGQIVVMNFDGSNARFLPESGSQPAWRSGDTSLLVTQSLAGGGTTLTTLAADGDATDGPETLEVEGESPEAPNSSLDETQVSYSAIDGSGERRTFLAAEDGSQGAPLQLPQGLGRVSDPVISPNGRQVVFSVRSTRQEQYFVDTGYNIYIAKTDGSDVTQLTDDLDVNPHAAWTPDGSEITYTRQQPAWECAPTLARGGVNLVGASLFPWDERCVPMPWVMRRDGSNRRRFRPPLAGVLDMSQGPGARVAQRIPSWICIIRDCRSDAERFRDRAGKNPYRALRKNIKQFQPSRRPGYSKGYGWAAHHIVMWNAKDELAERSQAYAYQCGMHPNSRFNGVWLRGRALRSDEKAYDALTRAQKRREYHPSLHTNVYKASVQKRIGAAFNSSGKCRRSRFEDAMHRIGVDLSKSVFPR